MDKRRNDAGQRGRLTPREPAEPRTLRFVHKEAEMPVGQGGFRQAYRVALLDYLRGLPDEDALLHAYDLGRRGAAEQLSILDLSEIHQSAMLAADIEIRPQPGKEAAVVIAKGAEFFGQVLAPFDMMYRGYAETIAQLRTLNTALGQKSEALRRSEERMRLFIKHNPAAVAMLDKGLCYVLYSPRWLTDYRLEERDLIGLSHYDVFPETPQRWRDVYRRCLAGATEKSEDDMFVRADGTVDYVRWEAHPWYDERQEIGGIIIFTEVITERKNQERKIARLTRIREIMSAINAAIVRIGERGALVREVCRILVEYGKFNMAWIGLGAAGQLNVTTAGDGGRNSAGMIEEPALLERALKGGKAIVCNDIASDRRIARKEEHLRRGYRSLVVFPLSALDKTAGVLSIYAAEAHFFDRDEMKLLYEMAEDISYALDHLAKEERSNYLAYYDSLTDLPNRALFFDRLQLHVESARREQQRMAVIVLDCERFSNINDSYGRHVGDAVLREAASRLKHQVSAHDTLAHIGGDRFALLLANVGAADAAHLLEKLVHECFDSAFQIGDNELYVSVKAGIAMFPGDGAERDLLYKNAEVALRKAKRSDEAYLFYRPEMNASVARRLTLENRLYRALEREEFTLYYQPKIHTATGRIVGLESLLRWNEPESGLVLPTAFIPILEETGMILQVGQWIMEKAVSDYLRWAGMGLKPPPIAINVSVIQLRHRNFVNALQRIRDKIPDGAHVLDLEITESIMMEDIDQNIPKLQAAKEMGMKIAMDDFGTGYSSLSYLTRLPIDLLKIDRSFVLGMNQSASGLAIVSSVISLAHSLQLQVIAEGVDDREQEKLLKLLNCDQLQGFLCSVPLPSAEIDGLLAA
ncbi:EAL domain-containing protein [Noviherbaspirillum sp. UKPF54]|uniref:EAL domain-containing protein n=1 Tax=Noviherbaspirillum sp. UKPF54 TaxID=2601898 RepID=UPI0011B1A39F|nr:EAL domain-containing protein [Noviherbaspirillum sp. UKPF54]QDZ29506.1 EAL domain-containing protein [Noviherbaspirillum sp. UKPF54]